MKHVSVDILYDPHDMSQVGFDVRTNDGSDLTAQEILDAISQVLLEKYDNFDMVPEGEYDA